MADTKIENKLLWRVYTGVIGAVTTIVAQKLVTAAWKAATGNEPPSPTDPETPFRVAATWALASGIGIGVTQLLTSRYAARRFDDATGVLPEGKKMKFRI